MILLKKKKIIEKIQIIFTSYDINEIKTSIRILQQSCKNNNIYFSNVVSLPTTLLSFPIKRSYFIYGSSKCHFGIKTYKKFFFVYVTEKTKLSWWLGIKINNIVNIKIKRWKK